MRLKVMALVALMALMAAACGGASPEAAGPSEGIQVHGDWSIDVYNPDGSLNRSVEFSNALRFGGEHTLNQLLGGHLSPSGLWKIRFGGAQDSTVCPSQASSQCVVGGIIADNGLTNDGDTVLSGSTTVEADGTIDYVETRMGTCSPATAPDDCTEDDNGFIFTAKNLAAGDIVSVSAGQTVEVQVTISFTTGN